MRALLAFDKFKDALSAREACDAAAQALHEKHPDWELDLCPLTDGGDGFEEVLATASGAEQKFLQVVGPRGGRIDASFSLVSRQRIPAAAARRLRFSPSADALAPLAVIEMAVASGLALLPPGQRSPWETTTLGTGQLMRAAMDAGAGAFLLGVGGSATHDLGLGALAALGLDFCEASGTVVRPPVPSAWERIGKISGQLPPGLPPVHVACDVTSPLLGPQGAATLFAPQKGLHADELAALEAASERMAQLLCNHFRKPQTLAEALGSGAAGGIAFGLVCATDAVLLPGYALVAEWLDLDARIAAADVVLTGEGRFDPSSLRGKGPGAVATQALAARKPVHLFAGQVASPTSHDLLAMHEITPADLPFDRVLRETALLLRRAVNQYC